jgi:hypothetical protein
MLEEDPVIMYEFDLPKGRLKFPLRFEEKTHQLLPVPTENAPEWTKLEVHQCENCPLNRDEHSHCPLALQIHRLVEETDDITSYDIVHARVRTKERTYIHKVPAQRALSSILGLMIPCSGCPHTAAFRPMAKFHLPFSTEEETTYRTASMYLLAQFFRKNEGLSFDQHISNLGDIYQQLQVINRKICERIKTFCKEDSSLNAVVILDMLSMVVPLHIENNLDELKALFSFYTQEES